MLMGQRRNRMQQPQTPYQPAPTCVVPLGTNAQNIRGPNGEHIMEDDPCEDYRDALYSDKNRGRRLGCRKAADRMYNAVRRANLNCLEIYHGQCIRNDATGKGACYVLVRRQRFPNSFFLVLLDTYCSKLRAGAANKLNPQVNTSLSNTEADVDQDNLDNY